MEQSTSQRDVKQNRTMQNTNDDLTMDQMGSDGSKEESAQLLAAG